MCGRYTLSSPADVLMALLKVDEVDADFSVEARYNIAPTTEVPCVGSTQEGRRKLRTLRWGLIPRWAKDAKQAFRMINARSETVAEKPAFRVPFRRRRVLVPADGFYEWVKRGEVKQPYLIRRVDRVPMVFAGIWERWTPKDGEPVDSMSILTTEANQRLAEVHHRMPVILPEEHWSRWLDRSEVDPDRLVPLLTARPDDELDFVAVSRRVNSVRNDDPSLLEPVDA
jgi:putative SOS response-associated peptidase YedK